MASTMPVFTSVLTKDGARKLGPVSYPAGAVGSAGGINVLRERNTWRKSRLSARA